MKKKFVKVRVMEQNSGNWEYTLDGGERYVNVDHVREIRPRKKSKSNPPNREYPTTYEIQYISDDPKMRAYSFVVDEKSAKALLRY